MLVAKRLQAGAYQITYGGKTIEARTFNTWQWEITQNCGLLKTKPYNSLGDVKKVFAEFVDGEASLSDQTDEELTVRSTGPNSLPAGAVPHPDPDARQEELNPYYDKLGLVKQHIIAELQRDFMLLKFAPGKRHTVQCWILAVETFIKQHPPVRRKLED